MSTLLEKASLVMIPSGYKEDTVYSVKPTDGSGDLTFTRASDGTRVNSAGLVEVAPWNLLQYSEDFSNSYWYKNQTTITTNAIVSPNGTTTADKLEATTTRSNYINEQTGFNLDCTRYIYAKAGNFSQITILWNSYNNGMFATFNLSAGTVTYGGSGITASIESVGDGWYKCITSGSANYPFLVTLNGVNNSTISVGSYVYIWGAQLNIGSTAKPYFPTTDRLNVPRLTYQNGGGGCPSLLLEPQRTNLVKYSEDYTQSNWNLQYATITANNTTSPDGTQNADLLKEDSTNNFHRLYDGGITVTAGGVYTSSVYAKNASGTRYLQVNFGGGYGENNAVFDLVNGTVISQSNATGSIESVGNGWYRCIVTATNAPANTNLNVIYYLMNGVNTNYTGNGTSGVYLWGSQLE